MEKRYYPISEEIFERKVAWRIRKYRENKGAGRPLKISDYQLFLWGMVSVKDRDTVEGFTEVLWKME